MRQTGGTALGDTSTRSRPRSRAIFRASNGAIMPSCSPASSITRTSRARILSLIRMKFLAERLSMGVLQKLWPRGHLATQYTLLLVISMQNGWAEIESAPEDPGQEACLFPVRLRSLAMAMLRPVLQTSCCHCDQ